MPAILGREEISDELRDILNLPARMGGMGFLNPRAEAEKEYKNSILATSKLTEAIFNQDTQFQTDEESLKQVSKEIAKSKEKWWVEHKNKLQSGMRDETKQIIQLASEKGASTWLTSLPLKKYGFRLNKQQFRDAICLRYNLKLRDVPKYCQCGQSYSIDH